MKTGGVNIYLECMLPITLGKRRSAGQGRECGVVSVAVRCGTVCRCSLLVAARRTSIFQHNLLLLGRTTLNKSALSGFPSGWSISRFHPCERRLHHHPLHPLHRLNHRLTGWDRPPSLHTTPFPVPWEQYPYWLMSQTTNWCATIKYFAGPTFYVNIII